MAGILGAKTNNSYGIAGVSGGNNQSGVTMIPYCVGHSSPDASLVDDAILDAVSEGAKVIQLSLSLGTNTAVSSAIEYAYDNNSQLFVRQETMIPALYHTLPVMTR